MKRDGSSSRFSASEIFLMEVVHADEIRSEKVERGGIDLFDPKTTHADVR